MTSFRRKKTVQLQAVIASVLTLGPIIGCNSAPSKPANTGEPAITTTAGPDIDLNCVVRHIQTPTDSFHYSFSVASENAWQEDADVTPQNIDGSFMNNFLPARQEFHGPPQQ